MQHWITCLITLLVLSCGTAMRAVTARVQVISSIEELKEAFGGSAVAHDGVIELSLRPTARWPSFGHFRSYTLRVLPMPVAVANVAEEHWKHGSDCVVRYVDQPVVRFEIARKKANKAYVAVHFVTGAVPDADMIEVLIPLLLAESLVEKKPNQALEPTTLLVMSRAYARATPSRVVAHL